MRLLLGSIAMTIGLTSPLTYAEAPANAPAGTTGLCKDGSYHAGPTKKGACAKHGGLKEWYTPAEPKSDSPTPSTAGRDVDKPKTSTVPARTSPAPGGGTGKVWVNTKSRVYHCQGTKWYGTTKKGEYMTEAEAKAAGNHADHGKACS